LVLVEFGLRIAFGQAIEIAEEIELFGVFILPLFCLPFQVVDEVLRVYFLLNV
jgi:hypothetical protein